MKCSSCGHWNRVQVNKIFIEHNTPEHKVKVPIPPIVESYVRKQNLARANNVGDSNVVSSAHRMESLVLPEIQMNALEMVKNRGRLAQGTKELVSYSPTGYQGTVGVWETDSAETLFPMLNALSSVGVDTEIPHCGVRNSDEEMGRRHQ